ncbi:MAG TPA: hypothetical protein VG713_11745 [Pirellulales bacterium]|nr:hypothetical protein [Pirellulales bacterium]
MTASAERKGQTATWAALVILPFALCALHSTSASAASLPALTSTALGFDGRYKLGCWTPLTVTLRGGLNAVRGVVSVDIADADGTLVRYDGDLVDVPAGLDVNTLLYVKLGRPLDELAIDFSHETPLADEPRSIGVATIAAPLEPDQALYVNVGTPIASSAAFDAQRVALVNTQQVEQLPDRWIGYESLDGLLLSTSSVELIDRLSHDTDQFLAIDDWIAHGGFVVVFGSPNGLPLLKPDAPLARLVPGLVTATARLPRSDALEAYVGTNERIVSPSALDAEPWIIPRLDESRGVVELSEGNLPLVVRAARGLGEMAFMAAAPSEPPLSTWSGRDPLVARLLHLPSPTIDTNQPGAARAQLYGVSDLSGQLFDALDQFDGVGVTSFWIVAGVAIVYLGLVGPVDFLFLQRVLRRLEWTWFTLPVASVAALVAIVAAGTFQQGIRDHVNQVDLVDIDVAKGRLRGTSWLALYTDRPREMDLALRRDVGQIIDDASDVALAWYAPSGAAWGGMHSRAAGPQVFDQPYEIPASLDRLLHLPVEPHGVKMFCGRWISQIGPTVDAKLHAGFEDSIAGLLENRLKVALSNCLLFYGRFAYSLGDINAGQRCAVTAEQRRELELTLKQFTAVRHEKNSTYLEAPLPYDPASLEVPGALRAMMFYEALGGRSYTGVPEVEQSFVDLSHLLRLKRAVLLAEIHGRESLGIQWRDGDTTLSADPGRRWRFCRFVFHVDAPEESGR